MLNALPEQIISNGTTIPSWELLCRLAWIGIRLVLVFALADEFQPFFYQAF